MLSCKKIIILIVLFYISTLSSQSAFTQDIFSEAWNGNVKAVKALLEKNPDLVHVKTGDGHIPLHFAAWMGKLEITDFR